MNRISALLDEQSIDHEVIQHPPTYDAQHLAEAVETTGHEVAKTVLLRSDVDYVLAVLPATCRINLKAVKQVALADVIDLATEAEISSKLNDCETGAIPPFGSHYGIMTLLDEALAEAESLVFDSEKHDEAIRMTLADYLELENPVICEIALPICPR
jgi:Ala-tRNA(Pro) deacylase